MPLHHARPNHSLQQLLNKLTSLAAKMDGMPKGLKITNHTGQVLYDSAWIAGVEYDQDELKIKIMKRKKMKMMTVAIATNDSNDDDYDDNDQYDKMDPDEIPALAEPLALQSDDEYEAQDKVELQDNNEEEADEEPKEEDDPNPTTAEQQQPPADNVRVTRSRQISKPQDVLMLHQSHLQTQAHQQQPYSIETA
jgi:hypothetical protein